MQCSINNTKAEAAIDYPNINVDVMPCCEVRAENEGTVAKLHIERLLFSTKEWRKLILSCIKFNTLNKSRKRSINFTLRSDYKIADRYLIGYNHV